MAHMSRRWRFVSVLPLNQFSGWSSTCGPAHVSAHGDHLQLR